jgi:hypothetical protein
MADLLDFAPVRVFTSNAAPGAGYIARFFQSGTTTPVTVFSDVSLNTPWGSSVTADAEGVFPAVFSSGGAIKATIETPAGAIVATIDPVQSIAGSAAGASAITFEPTPELPFDNVQDAIVGAAASAASGFAAFGLGVTGSVALIANLNATGTASGLYRFDNTTTGTFPTGVAAADTGAVRVERETAGSAWMVLYHDTTDRVFYRRMTSSTWGAWRENIIADIGATQGDILFRSATNWTRLGPGTSGQVLRTNGAGANPSWVTPATPAGHVFLGAITTTSGTSQTLGSLTLTGYSFLILMVNGVSFAAGNSRLALTSTAGPECSAQITAATGVLHGEVKIDLATGVFGSTVAASDTAGTRPPGGISTITTASTSVTVASSGAISAFDAGSVRVYGVL